MPTDTTEAQMQMKDVSEQLLSALETAEPKLREISELESANPILPGGWSRKQVLGHLNRFGFKQPSTIRPRGPATVSGFPGLRPEWKYSSAGASGGRLVTAGLALGRLQSLPRPHNRPPACRQAGNGLPHRPRRAVTLDFLAKDYVRHLLHHLNQIGAADSNQSPPPK